MTELEMDELSNIIGNNPYLSLDFRRMEQHLSVQQFNFMTGDTAILILMIRFLIHDIGLPWYSTFKRVPELYRSRVDRWIDQQYEKHKIDPYRAREAGDAVCHVLESVTEPQPRDAWEQLARQLGTASDPTNEQQSSDGPHEGGDTSDTRGT